jgi:hypothetical protein
MRRLSGNYKQAKRKAIYELLLEINLETIGEQYI